MDVYVETRLLLLKLLLNIFSPLSYLLDQIWQPVICTKMGCSLDQQVFAVHHRLCLWGLLFLQLHALCPQPRILLVVNLFHTLRLLLTAKPWAFQLFLFELRLLLLFDLFRAKLFIEIVVLDIKILISEYKVLVNYSCLAAVEEAGRPIRIAFDFPNQVVRGLILV